MMETKRTPTSTATRVSTVITGASRASQVHENMAALDVEPLEARLSPEWVLKVFAARTGAEIERRRVELYFCDRCHVPAGVHPDCWGCHYYPEWADEASAADAGGR